MLGIWMTRQVIIMHFTIWIPPLPYCPVFRWIRYSDHLNTGLIRYSISSVPALQTWTTIPFPCRLPCPAWDGPHRLRERPPNQSFRIRPWSCCTGPSQPPSDRWGCRQSHRHFGSPRIHKFTISRLEFTKSQSRNSSRLLKLLKWKTLQDLINELSHGLWIVHTLML